MDTKKEIRVRADHRFNSFGQMQSYYENVEYTTYTGTLDEMLELSETKWVYVKRSALTERFFPAWESDSKYVVIGNREAKQFAEVRGEIPGVGYYTPFFDVKED